MLAYLVNKRLVNWVNSFQGYIYSQLGTVCRVVTLTAHLFALNPVLKPSITRQRSLSLFMVWRTPPFRYLYEWSLRTCDLVKLFKSIPWSHFLKCKSSFFLYFRDYWDEGGKGTPQIKVYFPSSSILWYLRKNVRILLDTHFIDLRSLNWQYISWIILQWPSRFHLVFLNIKVICIWQYNINSFYLYLSHKWLWYFPTA